MKTYSKIRNASGFAHILIPLVVVVLAGVVGTYFIVQSHADTACTGRSFSRGSSGSCVKYIQQLANYQIDPRVTADGSFGPLTQTGVKAVQKSNGLSQDGIVGPHTWNALCNPKYYLIPNVVTFTNVAHSAGCKIYTATGPHAN